LVPCPICGKPATFRPVRVRNGKEMVLWHCIPCDYDFFAYDPTAGLAANKLDESRLKASGLDIPTRDADFANGLKQSRPLIEEYIDTKDRDKNVLEIGCSWGYFLNLVKEAGAVPYGVEVNSLRAQYVNDDLKIPCFPDIGACESRGLRFHKIFLFYVLEYIPQPVAYLQRLINLLDEGGSLIVISPNLDDAIKDLYQNEGFRNFFYDEFSINYFTEQSVRQMGKKLQFRSIKLETRQGYSFINHINWYLNRAPRTTNIVGGDRFIPDLLSTLQPDPGSVPGWDRKQSLAAEKLSELITEFDRNYRMALEKHGYGNQIRFVIIR
jgi:hypothetical protein